jgi:hypothetical protein
MKAVNEVAGLIKFSRREPWCDIFDEVIEDHIGLALDEFGVDFDELADLIGDQWQAALWGCAFEDMLTQNWGEEELNIVDEYLKRRGWNEKGPNKIYLKALRNAKMSLYEVSEIIPGTSMLARDMIREAEPILIHERSATRSLHQWDRIGARIVTVGGRNVLAGGLLPFTHNSAETVLQSFAEILALEGEDAMERIESDELLKATASLFSTVWLEEALSGALGENLPELSNSDGDEIIFHDARFPLAKGVTQKEVRAMLDGMPELRSESGTFWNWLGEAKAKTAPESGKGQKLSTTMHDGTTVLGNLELKGKQLLLSTNSAARAKRGQALIESALSKLIATPLVEIRTVAQLIAEGAGEDDDIQEAPLSQEDAKTAMQSLLDTHYRETLDLPLPTLNNVSPRDAVSTPEGRREVVEWLKYLENRTGRDGDAGDPVAAYDFGWIWAELGVEDLRR